LNKAEVVFCGNPIARRLEPPAPENPPNIDGVEVEGAVGGIANNILLDPPIPPPEPEP